ncbi:MAG: alpha/beta fold hydrolase [Candidatus Limnocylindrales bacterium]
MALVDLQVDRPTGALRGTLVLQAIELGVLRWDPSPGEQGPGRPGDGRSMLILHGLTSAAVTAWRLAETLVDDGWHVDALDLPGHGQSRWLGFDSRPIADQESVDPNLYRLDSIVGVLREAIQQLRLPVAPALVGHSWGAATALAVAATGMPLERTVLVDPPFLSPVQALELADREVASLRPDREAALEEVRGWPEYADPRDVESKAIALTQASPHAIRSICQAVQAWTVLDKEETWRQAREQAPVVLIAGDPAHGSLVGPSDLERVRRVVGPDHVTVIAGASHSPHRGSFPEFLSALRWALDLA